MSPKRTDQRFACVVISVLAFVLPSVGASSVLAGRLTVHVVDANTNNLIPCRVYVRDTGGKWFFVKTTSDDGSALAYREQWVPMPNSVEKHTTVSPHPFYVDLPPGEYEITIERGKEYLPTTRKVRMTSVDQELKLKLVRWVNMAKRGWFSGETHVHRRVFELPNVMLAEDLNVAFPVIYWTTRSGSPPNTKPSTLRRQGPSPFGDRKDPGQPLVMIDKTHVMFPRNTEYEIFSLGEERHVLGAVFILNHKTIFKQGMPPVARIAEQAHREGALLDLDKHSWPWSLILVPIAKVDLFELSNNSVWRTEFGFKRTNVALPTHASIERNGQDLTELGWLHFGFENYYTLLNAGFRLSPTAGTASGVHPVPLGYSRVYVETPGEFSPQVWLKNLKEGRSFVTTGPMLLGTVAGKPYGGSVNLEKGKRSVRVAAAVHSQRPITHVEVIMNGERVAKLQLEPSKTANGTYRASASMDVPIPTRSSSRWICLRCFEKQPDGRFRFAHSAPVHIQVDNQPVRPRQVDVDYLVNRTRKELQRSLPKLPPEAQAEYRKALQIFESLQDKVEKPAADATSK